MPSEEITRIEQAKAGLESTAIVLNEEDLARAISDLIADVGALRLVTKADLHVYAPNLIALPQTIKETMKYGTKIFDAIYYFALPEDERPPVLQGTDLGGELDNFILQSKKCLLWMAMFLMLRGSYPSSASSVSGADIPAFLIQTAGMNVSPKEVSDQLASFNLVNIPTGWIKFIDWSTLAPEIRQRFALGLAGYRLMGPFKVYPCRQDASPEVKNAYNWVREIATKPFDYKILSATRDPMLIARLGSWNKALGNLILLCFTNEQVNEMVATKILFQKPTRDARSDTWRTWANGEPIILDTPINL